MDCLEADGGSSRRDTACTACLALDSEKSLSGLWRLLRSVWYTGLSRWEWLPSPHGGRERGWMISVSWTHPLVWLTRLQSTLWQGEMDSDSVVSFQHMAFKELGLMTENIFSLGYPWVGELHTGLASWLTSSLKAGAGTGWPDRVISSVGVWPELEVCLMEQNLFGIEHVGSGETQPLTFVLMNSPTPANLQMRGWSWEGVAADHSHHPQGRASPDAHPALTSFACGAWRDEQPLWEVCQNEPGVEKLTHSEGAPCLNSLTFFHFSLVSLSP